MAGNDAEKYYRQWLWKTFLIVCFLQFYIVNNSYAQHYSWEDFLEKITVEHVGEEHFTDDVLLDCLTELHENPFNLNTADKEELEQLPFLSDRTIEDILAYIYRYGPMQSLGELKLIEGLDFQTREFLLFFVYVAPPEEVREKFRLKNLLKQGKHEVSTRMDIPLYQRDGYKIPSDEILLENPNKVYLGNKIYHNIRYNYTYRNKFFMGFTTEKDSGEPFGSYGNKGYDAYSFHLLLKDCGKLKTLALGDYRLGFGEGLIVNTGFAMGKTALLNMGDRKQSIRKFSSTAETSYFRGLATAFRFGGVEVSAFYSYLPMDGTVNKDGSISTLKTDGLHRTFLEISKKHNVTEQTVGGDITWHTKYTSVGVTGLYQHFNRSFSKGSQLYRQYYPEGNRFMNIGAHYRFRYNKFLFSGETAFSDNHSGWATLNRAVYRFNNSYSLTALQRLFTYQYVALRANSFSEGGSVRNESGFYVGFEAAPLNELKVSTYVDYFYFPWVKFATPYTSDGIEGTLQIEWLPHERWNVSGRYQLKDKERYGEPYLYHKMRLQLQYVPTVGVELRALGHYTLVRDRLGSTVRGCLSGGMLKWAERKDRVRLSAVCAWFDSEDYKAPMSFYEPSLPYTYAFITLYGKGVRTALTCRWNISKGWMLMMKYGMTYYSDRDVIGDGLERINGRSKNDVSFMMQYKF